METKWPFMFVVDGAQRDTRWVVLHAPIQSPSRRELFATYRRQQRGMIGMTSFMTFPREDPTDSLDYGGVCEGWCHCFADPDAYLPPDSPRALLSYSDFTDPATLSVERVSTLDHDAPRFDFVYVGSDLPWKQTAKNWPLARSCLSVLCTSLGLRGLVIGVSSQDLPPVRGLTAWRWLPHSRFLQVLARCRFLFAPYGLDASPRILAEALCLDVPVLVHRQILGGWQYVAADTGTFFDDEHDVRDAALRCLTGQFRPRAWYAAHFGPQRASTTLRALINRIDPGFQPSGDLRLTYALGPVAPD